LSVRIATSARRSRSMVGSLMKRAFPPPPRATQPWRRHRRRGAPKRARRSRARPPAPPRARFDRARGSVTGREPPAHEQAEQRRPVAVEVEIAVVVVARIVAVVPIPIVAPVVRRHPATAVAGTVAERIPQIALVPGDDALVAAGALPLVDLVMRAVDP